MGPAAAERVTRLTLLHEHMTRAEQQAARRRQSAAIVAREPDEGDWKGLLYGLALAIGGVLAIIGLIHLHLRYVA